MRLIPFLLLVLCALLEPFPVARAFEGARTPVIVGFQVDGIEPYESFVSNTKAALSEVLDDRAFIFKPIAREALSNPDPRNSTTCSAVPVSLPRCNITRAFRP